MLEYFGFYETPLSPSPASTPAPTPARGPLPRAPSADAPQARTASRPRHTEPVEAPLRAWDQ